MTTIKNYELRIRRIPVAEEPAGYGTAIAAQTDIERLARAIIGDCAEERFIAFSLDIKNRVMGYSEIGRGSVDGCAVDIRQVFRSALIVGASNLAIAHNHPSGDSTPSTEDRRVTERIADAGKLIGMPLIDHVIVTDASSYSFASHGGFGR